MKKKSSVNKAGNYTKPTLRKRIFQRLMNSASYGTAEYGGAEFVLVRQPIVGSGFAVALQFTDSAATQCSPYSLKGFSLEFAAAGRR